jgi:hypothetical protein
MPGYESARRSSVRPDIHIPPSSVVRPRRVSYGRGGATIYRPQLSSKNEVASSYSRSTRLEIAEL